MKQILFINWNIPKEQLTKELILEAVKQYGFVIKYVPLELFSEEVVLEAVKQNDVVIRYIPKELLIEVTITRKLESNTECLIMGSIIEEHGIYKMCAVKHVISYDSWLKIEKDHNKCCYCKGELLKDFFYNG
mgnify:FL=1